MRQIIDYDYGADADGNRGSLTYFYELEPEDTSEIRAQIFQYIEEFEELPPDPFTIWLDHPDSAIDIDFEINPFNYVDKFICEVYLRNLQNT